MSSNSAAQARTARAGLRAALVALLANGCVRWVGARDWTVVEAASAALPTRAITLPECQKLCAQTPVDACYVTTIAISDAAPRPPTRKLADSRARGGEVASPSTAASSERFLVCDYHQGGHLDQN